MVRITKQTSQVKFPRESREEMNTVQSYADMNQHLGVASAGHAPDFCKLVYCASASFLPFSEISIQKLRDYTEGDAATT